MTGTQCQPFYWCWYHPSRRAPHDAYAASVVSSHTDAEAVARIGPIALLRQLASSRPLVRQTWPALPAATVPKCHPNAIQMPSNSRIVLLNPLSAFPETAATARLDWRPHVHSFTPAI